MNIFISYFKALYKARYVLLAFGEQDFKNKYRHSFLGIGWALLNPLMLVIVIGVVFSTIMGQPIEKFIPFLFAGLLPWIFLTEVALGGANSFISAEGYIKQVPQPLEIYTVRPLFVGIIQLVFALSAFLILYIIYTPQNMSWSMFYVIPAIFIFSLVAVGLSTFFATITVFFRDFSHILGILFQALFYITPIIFPSDTLRGTQFQWLFEYNPFYYLLEIIRTPLLGMGVPGIEFWYISLGFALIINFLAIVLLNKVKRNIAPSL
jgi:ABC-type polysaccharide/polyol phosphate export permease